MTSSLVVVVAEPGRCDRTCCVVAVAIVVTVLALGAMTGVIFGFVFNGKGDVPNGMLSMTGYNTPQTYEFRLLYKSNNLNLEIYNHTRGLRRFAASDPHRTCTTLFEI